MENEHIDVDYDELDLLESPKLLMDIAQNEYQIENERSKNLDIKGNMLFVLCTTPLFYILNMDYIETYGAFLKNYDNYIKNFWLTS